MTESTTGDSIGEGVAEAGDIGSDIGEGSEESSEGEELSDEGSDEVSEDSSGEDAGEESAQEEEVRFEVTVDGQKHMVTRDQLIKDFQMGAASQQKFREAANIKKNAESSLEAMMADPIKAFLAQGGDETALRGLTETFLYKKLQQDKMTPEEREFADLKQYKIDQERRSEESKAVRQSEMEAAQTQKYRDEYETNFNQAFEVAGVASTPQAMTRVAQILHSAMEAGQDMPLDLVVDQYKEEQTDMINSYLSKLDSDAISSVIGKDRMREIRKKGLAGAKNPTKRTAKSPAAKVDVSDSTSLSDFFDNL
jgi:hypothetical protein